MDPLLAKLKERYTLTQECIRSICKLQEILRRVTHIDCTAQNSFQPWTRIRKFMETKVDSLRIGFAVQTMKLGISGFLATPVTLRAWLPKTSLRTPTEIQLPKLLVRSMLLGTTSNQEKDFYPKTLASTRTKTSEGSLISRK